MPSIPSCLIVSVNNLTPLPCWPGYRPAERIIMEQNNRNFTSYRFSEEEVSKAIDIYSASVKGAKLSGLSRTDAKTDAKIRVKSFYPDMFGDPSFCAQIAQVLYENYPDGPRPGVTNGTKIVEKIEKTNYMDVFRLAARTGFIPYRQYMKPFINGKSEQITSYISFLRKEGFDFQETQYGYKTIKMPVVPEPVKQPPLPSLPDDVLKAMEVLANYQKKVAGN
jgi:hypothetical protein